MYPGNLLKFSTLVLKLFKDLLEYYSCMYSGTALVLSLVYEYYIVCFKIVIPTKFSRCPVTSV